MSVRLLRDPSSEQERFERDLEVGGVDIPLPHRTIWTRNDLSQPTWFLAVLDEHDDCQCGVSIEVVRRRALPGTLTLRACQFGGARNDSARDIALRGLVELAKRSPRIVRVHVETYSFEEAVHEKLQRVLESLAFRRKKNPRCYEETVSIDLQPDEDEILAAFHPTARRHIRTIDKHAVVVRLLEDTGYATRMESLMKETLVRTGGPWQPVDWRQRIEFSRQYPKLSRIVGLCKSTSDDSNALLAFAWGSMHGKTAQYTAAASTRHTDMHIPLGYALAWDLIRWARRNGAQRFDFGGITRGTHTDGTDVLGGVSDFKRYFSTHRTRVASEWIYTPRPGLAATGDAISLTLGWLRP